METITATLPPAILWAAAQFASSDPAKDVLTFIQVTKNDDGYISIITTDGCRAFRVILPPCEDYSLSTDQLLIRAAGFKKVGGLLKGKLAVFGETVNPDMPSGDLTSVCRIIGHKSETVEFREASLGGKYAPIYPNVPQLWPDTFICEPGLPIAFNSTYVAEFMKVADKLSHNGVVSVVSNYPTTPVVFSCGWDTASDGIQINYLLMPVQLQTDEFKSLESVYKDKQQTKANDARELAAYRSGQTCSVVRPAVTA
jgi:hypothetical protein